MLAHGPPVAEVECSLGSKSADALLATGHAPWNDCTNRSRSLQCTLRQNRCVRNRSIAPGLCHPATGGALSFATAVFEFVRADNSGKEVLFYRRTSKPRSLSSEVEEFAVRLVG